MLAINLATLILVCVCTAILWRRPPSGGSHVDDERFKHRSAKELDFYAENGNFPSNDPFAQFLAKDRKR